RIGRGPNQRQSTGWARELRCFFRAIFAPAGEYGVEGLVPPRHIREGTVARRRVSLHSGYPAAVRFGLPCRLVLRCHEPTVGDRPCPPPPSTARRSWPGC